MRKIPNTAIHFGPCLSAACKGRTRVSRMAIHFEAERRTQPAKGAENVLGITTAVKISPAPRDERPYWCLSHRVRPVSACEAPSQFRPLPEPPEMWLT